MNINNLFSSKERLKILKYIIYKERNITISQTAHKLKLSKGLVSKYFYILVKEKLLSRYNNNFIVKNNINTRILKIFLNFNTLTFMDTFKKYKFVRGAGLYGSFVKGTNTEDSDIDMWILIKPEVREEEIAKLTNELKKKNEKISPLYLTPEKLNRLKNEDIVFYHSLIFGSINIFGEDLETTFS